MDECAASTFRVVQYLPLETSANIYQITWCHIPEGSIFQGYRNENDKSHIVLSVFSIFILKIEIKLCPCITEHLDMKMYGDLEVKVRSLGSQSSASNSYHWTKVALGQLFSENFGFPCQSTFHLLLHNHLHYHSRLAQ
jgi:hypothetical protein